MSGQETSAINLRRMAFVERHLRPLERLAVRGWHVKRYEITVDGQPIPADVVRAADTTTGELLPHEPPADNTPLAAFSVLHRGQDAVWLNAYAWCHEAIAWCRVASAPLDDPTGFEPVAEPLIGCVWELAVLVHERSAWVRHALEPQRPDLDGYLADVRREGAVGLP
jgi:hypothetical protein